MMKCTVHLTVIVRNHEEIMRWKERSRRFDGIDEEYIRSNYETNLKFIRSKYAEVKIGQTKMNLTERSRRFDGIDEECIRSKYATVDIGQKRINLK